MLLTTIATLTLAFAAPQQKALSCPIMGGPVAGSGLSSEYNGVKVGYCCEDCRAQFEHDPAKAMQDAAKTQSVVGEFLFDPVSHRRIEPTKAKGGSSDYAGVRYYFESTGNKKAFDKDAKKLAVLPVKEALYCPVTKEAVASYSAASGYADFKGVRYYFCCAGCDKAFAKDAGKLADGVADKVKAPAAIGVKAPATAESFNCKHCGLTIKVSSAAEMDKTCDVCGCGKSNAGCKPGV